MPLCESQREELLISFWTWLEYRTWDIWDRQDLITNRVPTVGLYSNHGMYFYCCSSQILMNTNKNPKQRLNSATGVGQIWSVLFVCLHLSIYGCIIALFLKKIVMYGLHSLSFVYWWYKMEPKPPLWLLVSSRWWMAELWPALKA